MKAKKKERAKKEKEGSGRKSRKQLTIPKQVSKIDD